MLLFTLLQQNFAMLLLHLLDHSAQTKYNSYLTAYILIPLNKKPRVSLIDICEVALSSVDVWAGGS